jgi:hypothetical protein
MKLFIMFPGCRRKQYKEDEKIMSELYRFFRKMAKLTSRGGNINLS